MSRHVALSFVRATTSRSGLRSFATQASAGQAPAAATPVASLPPTTHPATPDASIAGKMLKGSTHNDPLPVPPTVFPAPADPWDVAPATQRSRAPPKHSALRVKFAELGAKLLGYNSKASTSIRETRRMLSGIVEAIERDNDYWYGELSLPPTYQTFFQLHLLYILTLLPRLRALPPNLAKGSPSPVPESPSPSPPAGAVATATSAMGTDILSTPNHKAYPSELLNHFFELAETQMRRVLGRGERERVIKKYMDEMGQQWKGSGMAVDYAIGLSISEDPVERTRADIELASWLWRNLFDSRGLGAPPLPPVDGEGAMSGRVKEVELPTQLMEVVCFMRREMTRLDGISDADVLAGNIGPWGPANSQE